MDIEAKLRQAAQVQRAAFLPEEHVLKKMEQRIRTGMQHKTGSFQRSRMVLAAAVLLTGFLTILGGVASGIDMKQAAMFIFGENEEPAQKLIAPESFASLFSAYTGLEIKKIGQSPYANVFQETKTAIQLETEKGILHVVFFPNSGEAEKVGIDEDMSVSGDITFMFTGAELTKGLLPFRAKGPTYLFSSDNVLMISENLKIINNLHVMVYLLTGYQDVFQTLSIDPKQYEYWTWRTKRKEDSILSEDAYEAIKLAEMENVTQQIGDAMPGIFIHKNGNEALIVHKSADGTNHLYRFERKDQGWILNENVSKPGKIIQPVNSNR